MPPDPKTPTPDNEPSAIDDIFDADLDMYDGGTDDDIGDGAGDDTGGVPGDHPRAAREEPTVEEPDFPGVQFPPQTRQDQPQYDPENPRGYTRVGTLFADKEGNIVSRDGRVMAAKGEPARHWFNLSKQVASIPAMQGQVTALQRQLMTDKRCSHPRRNSQTCPARWASRARTTTPVCS